MLLFIFLVLSSTHNMLFLLFQIFVKYLSNAAWHDALFCFKRFVKRSQQLLLNFQRRNFQVFAAKWEMKIFPRVKDTRAFLRWFEKDWWKPQHTGWLKVEETTWDSSPSRIHSETTFFREKIFLIFHGKNCDDAFRACLLTCLLFCYLRLKSMRREIKNKFSSYHPSTYFLPWLCWFLIIFGFFGICYLCHVSRWAFNNTILN